jgi:hypothetical protein
MTVSVHRSLSMELSFLLSHLEINELINAMIT